MPPFLLLSTAGVVAVTGLVVAAAEVLTAGTEVTGLMVAAAEVAKGAVVTTVVTTGLVVVAVSELQPITRKAQINKITRGTDSFFNLSPPFFV